VFPGVWRPGEFRTGVPQGGGLVRRRRETTGAAAAAHQQAHGAERGVPEGDESWKSTRKLISFSHLESLTLFKSLICVQSSAV